MRKSVVGGVLAAFSLAALVACGTSRPATEAAGDAATVGESVGSAEVSQSASHIPYRYATAEEGRSLIVANDAYFDGMSQNDVDFRMQRTGATVDEVRDHAREQVLDFTDEDKALLDGALGQIERTLDECGYTLPPLDEVVLVKTTMREEPGAGAYTHGTEVYLGEEFLDYIEEEGDGEFLTCALCHELFHCLTRCNPDFRADMYKLIHFTVAGEDFALPESVFEYHISNPDVEHHDSWATFEIDGRDVDCFCDLVTTAHFEREGDSFFDTGTTALVPTDGTDAYYLPEDASNFGEVFGRNTDYVIDPEECMADNFAFALTYGMDGPEGEGYPNPEIIEEIIAHLRR